MQEKINYSTIEYKKYSNIQELIATTKKQQQINNNKQTTTNIYPLKKNLNFKNQYNIKNNLFFPNTQS